MIHVAGLDEMPRESPEDERARRRIRRIRRPDSRRCMWIGGGSISVPGDPLGVTGGGGPPPIVPINYASLFPGAYQVVQTDFGFTYAAALRREPSNAGNGTMARSGAIAGTPIPIWVRFLAGGFADIYYDGIGVTPAMAGVPCVPGNPIALTGAGSGLIITPAGGLVGGDTWKATCSALADQSGNAKDSTQVTLVSQPIVTIGLNGKPGLLFDGVDDFLGSTVGSLLTAGLAYQILVVGRYVAGMAANQAIVGGVNDTGVIYTAVANNMYLYNNGIGPNISVNVSTPQRFLGTFNQGGTDTIRVGPLSNTGGGTAAPQIAARNIGCNAGNNLFANVEVFAVLYTPITSIAAFDAALNTPQGYGPGAIAV